ncbi:MAG: hypothetical protein ABIR37_02270 [Candidatus Saccharimonadales bacterium]
MSTNESWEPRSGTIWDEESSWHGKSAPEAKELDTPTDSPILGDTVELSTIELAAEERPRRHVGFETDAGFRAEYTAWFALIPQDDPRHP